MEIYVRRLRKEGHNDLIPKKYQEMWMEPNESVTWESIANADWSKK